MKIPFGQFFAILLCSIIITEPVFAGPLTCCLCNDGTWQEFISNSCINTCLALNNGWSGQSYERKANTTCGDACTNYDSTCDSVGQKLCDDTFYDEMAICTQTSLFLCKPGTWYYCKDNCSCDNWTSLTPTNCSCTPDLITLVSFTATPHDSYVLIDWATDMEIDNIGFHLWRSGTEDGEYIKITDNSIPAQGGGYQYIFTDDTVIKGKTYYYKLEDIDLYGASTFHGPVSVRMSHKGFLPATQLLLKH